ENAEHAIKRFDRPRQHSNKRLTVDSVIEATAAHFHIDPSDLTGKSRASRINTARQIGMYLTRELTDLSLPQIGDVFGGRSHTTALHGINKVADEFPLDAGLRQHIEQ